jgi:outer membrane protein TolC
VAVRASDIAANIYRRPHPLQCGDGRGERAHGAHCVRARHSDSLPRVSDALVQYRKIRELRITQESLLSTLQDRARLSSVRYRGGVDTLLNVLDAERDLFSAELALTQTKRNELLALVQLYRALGGGWQE